MNKQLSMKKRMSHVCHVTRMKMTWQTYQEMKDKTGHCETQGSTSVTMARRTRKDNSLLLKYGHMYITNGKGYLKKHSKCDRGLEYQVKYIWGDERGIELHHS